MTSLNENPSPKTPPYYLLDVYGPRAVSVIMRYPDTPEIAAFGRTLPQKVADFQRVLSESRDLAEAVKKLVFQSAAESAELHSLTLRWRARMQLDLDGLDDIAITETKMADVSMVNARRLIEVAVGRGAELPDAELARSALETKVASTKAAWEATQVGRSALLKMQRELRTLAVAVHKDLVKLRKTVRLVLGSDDPAYQLLRIDRSRAAAEPPDETETDANSTSPSNGSSSPTSTG